MVGDFLEFNRFQPDIKISLSMSPAGINQTGTFWLTIGPIRLNVFETKSYK